MTARLRALGAILAIGITASSCGSSGSSDTAERGQHATSATTEWIQVESSNLAAIRYDLTTGDLDVMFHSGAVYRYFGVPEDLYDGLLNPPGGSHGKYFWAHIRNDFPYEKL